MVSGPFGLCMMDEQQPALKRTATFESCSSEEDVIQNAADGNEKRRLTTDNNTVSSPAPGPIPPIGIRSSTTSLDDGAELQDGVSLSDSSQPKGLAQKPPVRGEHFVRNLSTTELSISALEEGSQTEGLEQSSYRLLKTDSSCSDPDDPGALESDAVSDQSEKYEEYPYAFRPGDLFETRQDEITGSLNADEEPDEEVEEESLASAEDMSDQRAQPLSAKPVLSKAKVNLDVASDVSPDLPLDTLLSWDEIFPDNESWSVVSDAIERRMELPQIIVSDEPRSPRKQRPEDSPVRTDHEKSRSSSASSRPATKMKRSVSQREDDYRNHVLLSPARRHTPYRFIDYPPSFITNFQTAPRAQEDPRRNRRHYLSKANNLTFTVSVQRTYAMLHSRFSTALQPDWPSQPLQNEGEVTQGHNVVDAKRSIAGGGQHVMKLNLSATSGWGEEQGECQIQWLHLQRRVMDLREFEDRTLNAPKLSAELRSLVLQLFKRVRSACQTKFFDGYHIEPGTVLQCKGRMSGDTGKRHISATFICFPYLTLRHLDQLIDGSGEQYPIRTLLQTLYPHEHFVGRDPPPTFCKDFPRASQGVLYVPHLWVIIVGSKYVVTCAECDFESLKGGTISDSTIVSTTNHEASWDQHGNTISGNILRREEEAPSSDDRKPGPQLAAQHGLSDFLASDTAPASSSSHTKEYHSLQMAPVGSQESVRSPGHATGHHPDVVEDTIASGRAVQSEGDRSSNALEFRDDGTSSTLREEVQRAVISRFRDQEKPYYELFISLAEPKEGSDFFRSYIRNLKDLFNLPKDIGLPHNERYRGVIGRLDQCMRTAELLEAMAQLESEHEEFRGNVPYRNAMLRILSPETRGLVEEIQGFSVAIEATLRLFGEIMDASLHFLPAHKKATHQQELMSESIAKSLPFMLWGYSKLDIVEKDPAKRAKFEQLAAHTEQRMELEHLLTVIEDTEHNITTRENHLYTDVDEIEFRKLKQALAERIAALKQEPEQDQSFLQDVPLRPPFQKRSSSRLEERIHTQRWHRHITQASATARVVSSQIEDLVLATQDMVKAVEDFVTLFIPRDFKHRLLKRVWGALYSILNGIQPSSTTDRGQTAYIIRYREKTVMGDSYSVEPSLPFKDCAECRSAHLYRSMEKAMNHLKRRHFSTSRGRAGPEMSESQMHDWICTEEQLREEIRNERQLSFLRSCLPTIEVLGRTAKKIRAGVFERSNADTAHLWLPNEIVKSFEDTVLFVCQAAVSIVAIKDEIDGFNQLSILMDFRQETQNVRLTLVELVKFGRAAQQSMTDAEKILALSSPVVGVPKSEAAGPEFMVALILQNLQKRPLLRATDTDVNGLYQRYTDQLKYQVHRFPRKRLLPEIHALQDELTVIKWVNEWQQQSYKRFAQVLDSSISIKSGAKAHKFNAEKLCLRREYRSLRTQATELEALDDWAHKLRDQLKESVEILEEDHGKAILVFTMITTIFLPLSFVTSFFGMNTADIRNTDHQQGFFWIIAVPITIGIVGVAVVLAYQGGHLYDTASNALHQFRENSRKKARSTHGNALESTRMSKREGLPNSKTMPKRSPFLRKRRNADSTPLV